MKNVSFIIPNYNAETTVGKTVESILEQKYKNKFEVIVIDDKSTDKSIKILSKFKKYKNFRLVKNKKNIGLASSLNKTIELAKYDLISIIWCDCVLVGGDWLEKMVERFNSDDKIASVRSNLILPAEIWKKYNFWNKVNTIEEYIRNIKKIKFGRPTLFNKKLIKEVGMYNNKIFRIAGEDSDLCLKLIKRGYSLPLADTDMIHMHGFYKLSLKNQLFKKALPLAEASGVLFRRHLFLSNKYRNALTYTLIYLFSLMPSFIQPFFLFILILTLLVYTLRIFIYIKDIRIIFIPIYKFIKDLISLFGFWKGFITGKQEF